MTVLKLTHDQPQEGRVMGVYVDELKACTPNPRWRYREACHLVADTLTRRKRAFATRIGAEEIDMEALGEMIKRHRVVGHDQ
jgi:hypothetical protein